jgi:hypothetical protein
MAKEHPQMSSWGRGHHGRLWSSVNGSVAESRLRVVVLINPKLSGEVSESKS